MSDNENISEVLKGTVKWFNDAKGFGFIEHTSGRDVFVHFSSIESDGFKTLKDGEEVEYQLHEGPKGLHAIKVVRVNAPVTPLTDLVEVQTEASSADASHSISQRPQPEQQKEANPEG
jgi:CspA family cold shock protein